MDKKDDMNYKMIVTGKDLQELEYKLRNEFLEQLTLVWEVLKQPESKTRQTKTKKVK